MCLVQRLCLSPHLDVLYFALLCIGIGVWLLFEFHLPGIYQSVRVGMSVYNTFIRTSCNCLQYVSTLVF